MAQRRIKRGEISAKKMTVLTGLSGGYFLSAVSSDFSATNKHPVDQGIQQGADTASRVSRPIPEYGIVYGR